MKLILASTSPRRQEILRLAGLEFEVVPSDYVEDMSIKLPPDEMVGAFSVGKAASVAKLYPMHAVLGADTVVTIDNKILGKPKSEAEAANTLRLLSGRTHSVWTGFSWVCDEKGICYTERVESKITFREIDDHEIDNYIRTGEPMDKAGAYGIQGLGGRFVSETVGDYLNIVGLPLKEVLLSARKLGIN